MLRSRHNNISTDSDTFSFSRLCSAGAGMTSGAPLAMAACVFLILLLTSCGSTTSSGAPAHADAWLSFKYNNDAPGCGTYTQCPGLELNTGSAGNAEANAYYQAIGAQSLTNGPTLSLSSWLQQFGFPGTAAADHATYGNKYDLQLGRDMYCWQAKAVVTGPNNVGNVTACYVSNYGPAPYDLNSSPPGENPDWPNLESAVDCAIAKGFQAPCTFSQDQSTPQLPFATVAMVYSSTGIGANRDPVAFYVFGAPDQNGNQLLTIAAALDGEGPKTVPRMCMACHGGTYLASNHSVTANPGVSGANTASFLPFDVWAFDYSDVPGYDQDSQQESMRKLNADVLSTNPAPAIVSLINGLYSNNVSTPGTTIPSDSYVASGWSQNPTLYSGVFRKYCRMCHLAQDPPADFSSYSEFQGLLAGSVSNLVCQNGIHDMPHAEVPFGGLAGQTKLINKGIGFWSDLTAIADLNSFLQSSSLSPAPTPCPQP